MTHKYYSLRKGTNPNIKGLPLSDVLDLFKRVFEQLRSGGYFDEAFGYTCVDAGVVDGKVPDPELDMLLAIRKRGLWPIAEKAPFYQEDDLFDVIEFLYQYVSKPIEGTMHSYGGCGMHWETFNQVLGRKDYCDKINALLAHYKHRYEFSAGGEVLHKPEVGFEPIFDADLPTSDENVRSRIVAATRKYRRHGSTIDDRRQAVRDLADVMEYLRPRVKALLTSADEKDLFSIANNFGIRHHNDKQKTAYDAGIWLSWMFYFYLSTIHVVLRKIEHDNLTQK
ncbi:MAG: hypothetical protein DI603_13955 [Roseateles depolymerans]|uniref:Uncharacterized protein n=1 Tax=Roseateles depolymerans TaxID=76731 RepID=A0A2W5DIJ3_9BURK|nr:MAG: hypothetical protein DI603_13955 [Roseateles depolymerans]